MAQYHIVISEQIVRSTAVEADSLEEALRAAVDGEGDSRRLDVQERDFVDVTVDGVRPNDDAIIAARDSAAL